NLDKTALALARRCGLAEEQLLLLRELGQAINYNSYGDCEADLLIAPARLYRAIQPYANPFDFMADDAGAHKLIDGRSQDMAMARGVQAAYRLPAGSVYVLPDVPWARRVQGEFANELAARFPLLAHGVLCERSQGGYSVSVRAPLDRPAGADRLCRQFPGGGGRAGAAGIDQLAVDRLAEFIQAFSAAFDRGADTVPS
ncbi:MAG TPA: acetyltransferase, partial [Ramlibacter sp.]|nr:acetyltransferase [Ramlibacter sp.]